MRSALRKAVGLALTGALLSAVVVTTTSDAEAQSAVSGSGKGIAGGALLGEEVGLITLSAAGAKQTWMYLTIPTALAIGGGVGGYFVEKGQEGTNAEPAMLMLAGGMALAIPAIVLTLSANAYSPGSEDSTPADSTPADAGKTGLGVQVDGGATSTTTGSPSVPTAGAGTGGGTTTTAPPTPPKHKPSNTSMHAPPIVRPLALVNFDELTTLKLGLPMIALRPMYSRTELAQFGQSQKYEVNAPIMSVAF